MTAEQRRLAAARTCYDHLAGRVGVQLHDTLITQKLLSTDLALTTCGERWFSDLGVDLALVRSRRRTFARECLDWTERRPHLAGALGAALCDQFLARGWVRRTDATRRLTVTDSGTRAVKELLGIG